MCDRDGDQQLPGGSLLRDHAQGFAAHEHGGSSVPIDDLLAALDIPRADLAAFEATRNLWAGEPMAPDPHASLDHLVTVLASLPAELIVHDAIGWVCATWSTIPESGTETTTDIIARYGAAPGAWVFHAAGIPPEDVEHVNPEAVEVIAVLAVARGAILPPRR
ncbi:hypothetical protein ACOCJ7_04040 [Knoellia sp. CPCC 206453]|uniref:hypothetical protein n=1 Tax=Knoellia pratensis TaxID=3404796 RepID=UPI00361CA51C